MAKKTDAVAAAVADVTAALERLVETVREETESAVLARIQGAVRGTTATGKRRGRPKKAAGEKSVPDGAAKPKKKRRSSWEGLTPEQRLERVNRIREGKGLPPKKSLDD